MKPVLEYLFLGAAIVVATAAIVVASCTPAERQAFNAGVLIGDAACVFAAKCAGVPDVADFCRITADALKLAEKDLGDAYCPLPDRDAGGK